MRHAGVENVERLARTRGSEVSVHAAENWTAPTYRQCYSRAGFLPDLAIVDLLFNEGPRSREILLGAGGISYPVDGC